MYLYAGERLFVIPHVAVGIVLALIGFVGYSHARLNKLGQSRRAARCKDTGIIHAKQMDLNEA